MMLPRWLPLSLLAVGAALAADPWTVARFSYSGYLNVWFSGATTSYSTGFNPSSNRVSSRNACANLCSLDSTCAGFFVNASSSSSADCHTVSQAAANATNVTVGYGWQTQNIYYEKSSVLSSPSTVAMSDTLLPPCDFDTSVLSASDRAAASPAQAVTYYTCTNGSSSSYADSVALVSDTRCSAEDRLLQCELSGAVVQSNILVSTQAVFDPAFVKTKVNSQGLITTTGPFSYVTMAFKNGKPVRLSRLIVRSINVGVEHLQTATVTVNAAASAAQTVALAFPTNGTCAALINFNYTSTSNALAATSVSLGSATWFAYVMPQGFKIDLFVVQ